MKDFVSDLNQLDESEVLSQEWIERNTSPVDDEGRLFVWKSDLQNLLVPKQELPVIPKFVAETIEEDKERGYDVYDSIDLIIETDGGGILSISDWVAINIDKYARAWLNGYTVEEQKYHVIDSHKVYLLAKEEEERNKVETVAKLVEFYGHEHVELNYQLTEQEIKDYDERYFAFAVKVEELEE